MPDPSGDETRFGQVTSAFGHRVPLPERIEVDFGAGPRSMVRSMTVLNLSHAAPADGPVDFTALDEFPQARTIEWSGASRGITEALATRPHFHYVNWHHAVGQIDLSRTGITSLRLYDCARVDRLRLPEGIELLMLRGPSADLRVDVTGERNGLRLILFPKISFDAPPGTLTDPQLLAGHRGLRSLELGGAFDLDPAAIPHLPALKHLHLDWTRKAVAKALRKRFRGTGVKVCVYGALSKSWLAEQSDNPFMDWVVDSKKAAKAAGAAYARARKPADAGGPVPPVEAERALRRFIADLNALDEKYGVLDTAEREQVRDVYDELVALFHLDPKGDAAAWFHEDRRF